MPLEYLADRDWILFPPEHGLWALVAEACGRAGFAPRKTVETQQVEAAVRLAAAGVGVLLVPSSLVPVDLRSHVRRLRRPVVRRLTAYTRTEWSPAAGAFLEVLRAQPWQGKPRVAEVIG